MSFFLRLGTKEDPKNGFKHEVPSSSDAPKSGCSSSQAGVSCLVIQMQEKRETFRKEEHQKDREDLKSNKTEMFKIRNLRTSTQDNGPEDCKFEEQTSQTTHVSGGSSQNSNTAVRYKETIAAKVGKMGCVCANNKTQSCQHCQGTCTSYFVYEPNCNENSQMQTVISNGTSNISLVEYCSCTDPGTFLHGITPDQVAVVLHKNFFKGM